MSNTKISRFEKGNCPDFKPISQMQIPYRVHRNEIEANDNLKEEDYKDLIPECTCGFKFTDHSTIGKVVN